MRVHDGVRGSILPRHHVYVCIGGNNLIGCLLEALCDQNVVGGRMVGKVRMEQYTRREEGVSTSLESRRRVGLKTQ